MKDKSSRLFLILGAFFIANAILAEFIGVKIFSLERSLSIEPLNISIIGVKNLSFNMTAGVLLWPIVFILTDIINEYFGKKGVKMLTYIAVGIISYSYIMILFAINLVPADFWISTQEQSGVTDMNVAFKAIFGQGLWIIIGSLVAFLIGQLIDVTVFQFIKNKTGETKIWFRATGSTLVSQLIDSFVVLFIAFYIGADWSLQLVFAIGIVNYIYKCTVAIILTPALYIIHFCIDKYLGNKLANTLLKTALND